MVLKGSSSWSTTRKKKSSSLNSVRLQGVLRKLFLRAALATLCTGKCFSGLCISCTFFSHWKNLGPQRFLTAGHLKGSKISAFRVLGYSSGFLRFFCLVWFGFGFWFFCLFVFVTRYFHQIKLWKGKIPFPLNGQDWQHRELISGHL